jgi:hypothetical protein
MRQIVLILAVLAASAPAKAQSWKEFRDPAYSFGVSFPGDPEITTTTYQVADGRAVEARVYSLAEDNAVFKVTIAEIADPALDEKAVIDQAISNLAQGGDIKVNIAHRVGRVFGRQLSIAEADGSRLSAAVFYVNGRLYQIEGKALATGEDATGEAIRFQQSLIFTDRASNRPAGERRGGDRPGRRGPGARPDVDKQQPLQ